MSEYIIHFSDESYTIATESLDIALATTAGIMDQNSAVPDRITYDDIVIKNRDEILAYWGSKEDCL